jgi:hypothetical protein
MAKRDSDDCKIRSYMRFWDSKIHGRPESLIIFYLYLLAIRIKYILLANLLAKTQSSCAYYVMMRSSPVRRPLQPSIRSTSQDFYFVMMLNTSLLDDLVQGLVGDVPWCICYHP